MATEAQIAANRRNAQQSTGPRTPVGKRRVSRNAITHGLTCRNVVLADDDRAEFKQFRASMIADGQPVGAEEQNCMEKMVAAHWRLMHLWEQNTDLYAIQRERLERPDAKLGSCLLKDMQTDGAFANLSRIEAHLDRMYTRASKRLQELQEKRRQGLRHIIDEDETVEAPGEVTEVPVAAVASQAPRVPAEVAPHAPKPVEATSSLDRPFREITKQTQLPGFPSPVSPMATETGSGGRPGPPGG